MATPHLVHYLQLHLRNVLGSHYRTTVMDADPASYWRLNDPAGTDTAASEVTANEGSDNAAYKNVVLGTAAGPLRDHPPRLPPSTEPAHR
ncbi:hypothetical protein GXW82_44210 [Streptacidiphilus sp. 4-A2]|nr:hypothetical protein [Streptacidiphilus sp. 4-A2]